MITPQTAELNSQPPCQRCGKPYLAHDGGRCPRRYTAVFAIIAVITLLALIVLARAEINLSDKSSPPPACQLLGGSWSIWDGWRCQ